MSAVPRAVARIDAYLRKKDPRLRQVARRLRALVKAAVPDVTETVNPWGLPTFELNGPMCYFAVGKNHVTFGFLRGTSLDDPKGLLEGTGKNLRHVKVRKKENLSQAGLRRLVVAAARLNRESPSQWMPTRRKR
jgi:hypothetical protein